MKEKRNLKEYLKRTENPYQLQIGDMVIEMKYSQNAKRIDECMRNIIKQKIKME